MSRIAVLILWSITSMFLQQLSSQEVPDGDKAGVMERAKDQIIKEEREALKRAVAAINSQIAKQMIDKIAAQQQKEALAKKHASNIENRLAIVENTMALEQRNGGDVRSDANDSQLIIGLGAENGEDYLFGINVKNVNKKPKYDRRTSSGPVLAIGLHNVLMDGQGLEDSPYEIGGSRFFELGWAWRSRVLKHSNLVRFTYGVSMQFNGLKPTDNRFFVNTQGQTVLEEFPLELKKSKLRMDNLVVPLHLEFGGSEVEKTEDKIRYDTTKKFKFGIGGFAGFTLHTVQKLKYTNEKGEAVKEKIKKQYNRNRMTYGVSSYLGFGNTALYVKYDISPLFQNALIDQHTIALGLRLDL